MGDDDALRVVVVVVALVDAVGVPLLAAGALHDEDHVLVADRRHVELDVVVGVEGLHGRHAHAFVALPGEEVQRTSWRAADQRAGCRGGLGQDGPRERPTDRHGDGARRTDPQEVAACDHASRQGPVRRHAMPPPRWSSD